MHIPLQVVEWTPQNELLGDGRVKVFVTHGGLNSIYEVSSTLNGTAVPWASHAKAERNDACMTMWLHKAVLRCRMPCLRRKACCSASCFLARC